MLYVKSTPITHVPVSLGVYTRDIWGEYEQNSESYNITWLIWIWKKITSIPVVYYFL